MNANSSSVRRLASMSTILLLGQIAYYAVYIWGIRIILSTLPKAENGILTFVQQWATAAFSIALMTGYNTYIIHQLRTGSTPQTFYSSVVWLRLGISVTVALALAALLFALARISPAVTLLGAAAVLLMSSGNTLRTTLELFLHARMKFSTIVLLCIVDAILIVLLLWQHRQQLSAATVFTIQAVSTLPSVTMLVILAWRSQALRIEFDRSILSMLFKKASPLSLVALLIYAHGAIDITLLALLSNPSSVGIFGATNYATIPLSVLQGTLWTPLIPLLSQAVGSDAPIHQTPLPRAFRLVVFVIGFAGIMLAVVMPHFVTLLTSGAYSEHTTEFLLQVWVFTFSAILFAVQHYGSLLSQFRIATAAVGTLVAGSLIFDWWLITRFDVQGLLIAKLLSSLSACVVAALLFVRAGYRELGREIARLLAWLCTVGAVVIVVWTVLPPVMLVRGGAMSIGSLLSAWAMGVIGWRDRVILVNLLRRQRSSL